MIRRVANPLQWGFALLLSVMLWVLSIKSTPFEIKERLPLQPPSLSSDYIVLGDFQDDSVVVTFSGRGIEVLADQIMSDPLAVRLNLIMNDQSGGFPVNISRDFTEEDVVYGNGSYSSLSPTLFSPGSVSFTVDRTTARDLPVSVRSSTSLPERYFWKVTSVETVEIKGAESVLSEMDSLTTLPVDPDSGSNLTAIVKPDGVMYISPSSITAELIPPVPVISRIGQPTVY